MGLNKLSNTLFEDILHTDDTFAKHFHDTYTIGITNHGMFKSAIGNDISYAYANSVRITNPTEMHGGESECWGYTNFYPSAALLTTIYQQIFHIPRVPIFEKHIIDDKHLFNLLHRFFLSVYSKASPMQIETNLIIALSHLITQYTSYTKEIENNIYHKDIIHESIVYIKDMIDSNILLEDLAKSVSLSKYHFLRLFKHHMGITPHNYIMTTRVQRALSMIKDGSTISNASYHMGFSDQSHFTRSFKKIYGYTPAAMHKKSNIILYK